MDKEKFEKEVDIIVFYSMAQKYGFYISPKYCLDCAEWIEGPYADCSACSTRIT